MNTVLPHKGFSLVEALVSIGLLLLVVVGPMQILRQASISTQYASEQMTAYFLAQEGLELVHQRRDDLLLEHFSLQFQTPSQPSNNPMSAMSVAPLNTCFIPANPSGCGLHIENSGALTAQNCSTAGACRLRLENSTTNRARYSHTAGTPTPYTRRITIERTLDPMTSRPAQFKVTSVVEWRTGSLLGGQRVELTTYLQNSYDIN